MDQGGAGAVAGKKGPIRGKRDFTPVAWDLYFERMSDLKIANDVSFISMLCHYHFYCCFVKICIIFYHYHY